MSSGKWRSFRFGLNVLKPDLEVFDVTMHEDKYGQEFQITKPVAKQEITVLITIITWRFPFHPMQVSILHLTCEYAAQYVSQAENYV